MLSTFVFSYRCVVYAIRFQNEFYAPFDLLQQSPQVFMLKLDYLPGKRPTLHGKQQSIKVHKKWNYYDYEDHNSGIAGDDDEDELAIIFGIIIFNMFWLRR